MRQVRNSSCSLAWRPFAARCNDESPFLSRRTSAPSRTLPQAQYSSSSLSSCSSSKAPLPERCYANQTAAKDSALSWSPSATRYPFASRRHQPVSTIAHHHTIAASIPSFVRSTQKSLLITINHFDSRSVKPATLATSPTWLGSLRSALLTSGTIDHLYRIANSPCSSFWVPLSRPEATRKITFTSQKQVNLALRDSSVISSRSAFAEVQHILDQGSLRKRVKSGCSVLHRERMRSC